MPDTIPDLPSNHPAKPAGWLSMRSFLRGSIALFLFWLVICLMLVTFQRRLVFPGYSQRLSQPLAVVDAKLPPGRVFDVRVPVEPNLELAGWVALCSPAEDAKAGLRSGQRPVVIYFGGNARNRARRHREILAINNAGADVVIVDYRGYAENSGYPTETGLTDDARAVWKTTTETLSVPRERIVVWGESLGGAVATRLTSELCEQGTPPAGLILRATFASLVETAAYHYPFVPVRTVLQDRFPSIERIPNVTCPILHFHGTKDRVVPYIHGQELFNAAPERSESGLEKTLITMPQAGHNDIMFVAAETIENETREFLKRVFGK